MNETCEERKQSQIGKELGSLRAAVVDLGQASKHLLDDLAPVLNPVKTGEEAEKEPAREAAPLVGELVALRKQIEQTTDFLRCIRERLVV